MKFNKWYKYKKGFEYKFTLSPKPIIIFENDTFYCEVKITQLIEAVSLRKIVKDSFNFMIEKK